MTVMGAFEVLRVRELEVLKVPEIPALEVSSVNSGEMRDWKIGC